jgi:hypothetical protein
VAATDEKKLGPRKAKSGAQKRREKREREEAARAGVIAQAKDLGIKVSAGEEPPEDDGEWAQEFEEAGDVDLENPDTDLAYVRKLQLICLRQMATTANPSRQQEAAWRRIREMSAVVGMTSNRAKLEADVKALKAALKKHEERGSAMNIGAGASIPKSPGARGQRRGPRPLPPEPDTH